MVQRRLVGVGASGTAGQCPFRGHAPDAAQQQDQPSQGQQVQQPADQQHQGGQRKSRQRGGGRPHPGAAHQNNAQSKKGKQHQKQPGK